MITKEKKQQHLIVVTDFAMIVGRCVFILYFILSPIFYQYRYTNIKNRHTSQWKLKMVNLLTLNAWDQSATIFLMSPLLPG